MADTFRVNDTAVYTVGENAPVEVTILKTFGGSEFCRVRFEDGSEKGVLAVNLKKIEAQYVAVLLFADETLATSAAVATAHKAERVIEKMKALLPASSADISWKVI